MEHNQDFISVIIPVFNAGQHIEYFYSRLSFELIKIGRKFEIIFVNDGSNDDTLEKLVRIKQQSSALKIVNLSSNLGQYRAIDKGIAEAGGEVLIIMDDDQEYALEYMQVFLSRIANMDDLVLGWRRKRAIPVWRKAGTWVTNLMVSAVIRKRVHDMGAIKIFGNKAACLLRSRGSFFEVIKYSRHMRISEISIDDLSSGYSRYNLRKLSLLFFQVVCALLNHKRI